MELVTIEMVRAAADRVLPPDEPYHFGAIDTDEYRRLERLAQLLNAEAQARANEVGYGDDRYDEGFKDAGTAVADGKLVELTKEASSRCADYEARSKKAVEEFNRHCLMKVNLKREIDELTKLYDELALKHAIACDVEVGLLERQVES